MNNSSSLTIQNFKILKTINKGAFAQVYEVLDTLTNRTLALKIQKMDQMFYTEVKIMKSLRKYKIQGFPSLDQYGSIDQELGFIAMELLGPNSLEVLRKIEQRNQKEKQYGLPLASIIAIAIKLIASLQGMHETGYLHSDVKPNNVVFEQFSEIEEFFIVDQRGQVQLNDRAQVYLLDFGLSETYLNSDGSHIQQEKINRQLGNKFFMSLSQLKKNVSSRRDDLEQLIYTLIFLTKGDLPWSLKRNYSTQDIIKAKSTHRIIDMLFQDIPFQFRQAFDYIKSIGFNEKPDYVLLQQIFRSMLTQLPTEQLAKSSTKRPQIVTPREIDDIYEYERKKTHSMNDYSLGSNFLGQRQSPLIQKQQLANSIQQPVEFFSQSTNTAYAPGASTSQITRVTNLPEQGTNSLNYKYGEQKSPVPNTRCCQTSDELRNCFTNEEKKQKSSITNSNEQHTPTALTATSSKLGGFSTSVKQNLQYPSPGQQQMYQSTQSNMSMTPVSAKQPQMQRSPLSYNTNYNVSGGYPQYYYQSQSLQCQDVDMSREEECVKVECEQGATDDAGEEVPTSRFQPIYRRQAKPMDLRNLRCGQFN